MIKPGLTGWAQVSNGLKDQRDEGWELERFQYDLYYLNNCSAGLDLLILMKTLKYMLKKITL
jgi:putative colanic acid biosynthesis UDP-glucose lipid carrier transferase